MVENIINAIQANIKIIQIISYEQLRVHGFLVKASQELKQNLYVWNRIDGLCEWKEKKFEKSEELPPTQILEHFLEEIKENSILLLEDFYPDFTEDKPSNIALLRKIALLKPKNKTLVLSQPFHALPRELEKDVLVLDVPYPNHEEIKIIYKDVCKKYGLQDKEPDSELIDAALGLTIMEAERAFSIAVVQDKQLTKYQIPVVIKEKEQIIKKSGFLEYYHPNQTLKDVGGLVNLKSWLTKRGHGFTKEAKDFGLDTPRGILLLGIPGTGKSLTAKAIGNEWKFPLLKLDMGKIFGGIVGESEKNIRQALQIAEALAPSVLWIDEIEKGLAGMESSGSTDGGTTARVLGTFLTWMQEKTKPVFVVATANNIAQLPPELLRKGRVDEIFFVDLPTEKERKEILSIHLTKKGRKPDNFDLELLAKQSKGFSGAELEEVVKEALFQAYDAAELLKTEHIQEAIKKTYPLSKTMREIIENMRKWAKSRAVFASDQEPETLEQDTNSEVPKLKQEEIHNPFI